MTTYRQTSMNLTPATEAQLDYLKANGFGGTTDIVRIAIDRMAQQEGMNMTAKTDAYGRITTGTYVTLRDGSTGQVVNSNPRRTLVQYPADGGGTDLDWFDNEEVKIK